MGLSRRFREFAASFFSVPEFDSDSVSLDSHIGIRYATLAYLRSFETQHTPATAASPACLSRDSAEAIFFWGGGDEEKEVANWKSVR